MNHQYYWDGNTRHLHTGSITRRGSHVARWILSEAAQASGIVRDNALKRFLIAKKATIGNKKAKVATARKMTLETASLFSAGDLREVQSDLMLKHAL